MLAEIPASLFHEWLEYFQRQPFGEERADLRAGIVSSAVVLAMTGKKVKPSVFMPKFRRATRRQTPEDVTRLMDAMMQSQNAAVGRRKRKRG